MENLKTFFKKKNIDFFFPIAFILTIIPLIVRMTLVNSEQAVLDLFGTTAKTDLFSQRKAFLLILFCIILVCISIIFFKKIFKKKDNVVNSILIASAVFLLFTFLSTVFSTYKETALWGIYDRAEGFVTICCYIVLFIYSIYAFENTNNYKYLITPILILVFINSFLGLFQYVGQDLIKTNLGTAIVIPSEYQSPNTKMNLLYEAGKLYGTLFHYNYVGSFVAIVLPILLCLTVFEYEDIMYKICLGIGVSLSIWLLFGSTSRAGIIGIIASAILGIIIFWKQLFKKWKSILICIASLLVIAFALNFATKGAILEKLPGLASDIFSVFKDTNNFDYRDNVPVKDIKYTDKDTEIILQNETLKISYENTLPVFRNSKDEIINYVKNNNILTTDNETFKSYSFKFGPIDNKSPRSDGLLLNVNNQPTFMFALKDNNKYHLINLNTKKDIDLETPETFGFKGKEKLGSARGYIWSRSIPIIKNNLILGGGPDTFAFRFPQNDLIAKYYAYDTPNMIVDKPHNLFLQIALNEGVIALIAFLAIMIIYIADSIKLYAFKNYYNRPQVLGAAACLGVTGYLFAGIFNDSVVSVAPIFWIILGVGVAINYMNRSELNKKLK
ncbi:O-antigen ligase domain-containing protein [Clostridium chromiireducens]|uniref:O-antigen ligase domain-containing protein n=1 Tax=Clostridium chromiireducens TaxID=225345 RepID=A0A964RJN3_9CLOT|nr:O-antigen ligase family protein [Clostridium chromiireducens]MVX62883.1 O-antigen ligase domain-containing protein [Clostridium chromiireducens]